LINSKPIGFSVPKFLPDFGIQPALLVLKVRKNRDEKQR